MLAGRIASLPVAGGACDAIGRPITVIPAPWDSPSSGNVAEPVATTTGFGPVTSVLSGRRSNRLSYIPKSTPSENRTPLDGVKGRRPDR